MTQAATARVVVTTTIPLTGYALFAGKLRWLAGQGLDVHYVSDPGDLLDRTAEREGVTAHGLPMCRPTAPARDLLALWRWIRLLRRLRPDIVSYSTPKAGLLTGVAARLLGVRRRVYLLRGLRYEGSRGLGRALLMGVERLTCATAHVIVAESPSLAATVVRARIAPAAKVTVIGAGSSNGVDPAVFRPPTPTQRAVARASFGVPAEAVVVGFVGRLAPDKGLACLAAALPALLHAVPGAHVVLIGWPDGCPESVLAVLTALDRVHLVDSVDDPVQRFAAFDVLCLPTRREGLPTVVLEAAACAIPAVTTRATGAVDSVLDGRTGLLVDVDDPAALSGALVTLCQEPETRARLGAAARERMLTDFYPQRIWAGLAEILCAAGTAAGTTAGAAAGTTAGAGPAGAAAGAVAGAGPAGSG